MRTPNIFKYATSELSQDAFLCWFIEWSDPQFKMINQPLHQSAVEFVKKLCAKQQVIIDSIESVAIKRQVKWLDILVIVNEQVAILIEDKTYTSEHSNQLKRYVQELSEETKDYKKVCIYLKIGEQSHFKNVEEAGFSQFLRTDLLGLLRKGKRDGVNHAFFLDYLEYLEEINLQYSAYTTLPVTQWNAFAWQGFYKEIQKYISGNWGYVSNPRGGFWGFWWETDITNKHFFLLEQETLVVKITNEGQTDLKEQRNNILNNVLTEATKYDLKLRRPKRLRTGKTMTIAQREDYLQMKTNGLIDLEATVNELKKYSVIKI